MQNSHPKLAAFIQEIQTLCLEKLSVRVRSTDQDLFDSGVLDSLSLVQLILELERHYHLQLPLGELDISSLKSIESMALLIAARKQDGTAAPKVLDQLAS